ncbi:MAG: DUF5103 domain-containing protein [Prevotellaceae bacterium]|nr:DUF5103 domain-containing protein [Prevotellaceae bacterium]
MKKQITIALLMMFSCTSFAQQHEIRSENIASLQVVSGTDWMGDAIIRLDSNDRLNISFDELSHQYRRYVYALTHCDPNWYPTDGLFTSDYVSGYHEDITIDNYQESINTNQLYTHYTLRIPNSSCKPKISGNYRLDIIDDETKDTVITTRFMVTENIATIGKNILTDTDVDVRNRHQQISLRVDYPASLKASNPREQFRVLVMQNHRSDNQVWCPPAPILRQGTMEWTHTKDLIFPAGNEYHKFEILDVHRNSLGVDRIDWDGEWYNVHLYHDYPRRAYVYDEDADGAFYLRNSDNIENDIASEYVKVNFYLDTPRLDGDVYLDGKWTYNELSEKYLMQYDEENKWYHAEIPLKYGYYSYQYLNIQSDNVKSLSPTRDTEGDFYQTENRYLIMVYYRGNGDRYWRLVGAN